MTADAAALASIEAATRELRLPGIRLHAGRLAAEAQRAKATYLGFLADTLSVEVDDRAERRRTRRIHEARFPRSKRLADFNFDVAPTVNPATIATLVAGSYLDAGDPIVLLGDSGTGKTHLLIGLGIAACEQARRVRYATCAQLVNELVEAADERRLARLVARYGRLDLLLIDEAATSSSTPVAPSCCSRCSPRGRRNPPSGWPATCRSASGTASSPTPASSPQSSTGSRSTPTSSRPAPSPTGIAPAAPDAREAVARAETHAPLPLPAFHYRLYGPHSSRNLGASLDELIVSTIHDPRGVVSTSRLHACASGSSSAARTRIDESRYRESSQLTGAPGSPASARDETAEAP